MGDESGDDLVVSVFALALPFRAVDFASPFPDDPVLQRFGGTRSVDWSIAVFDAVGRFRNRVFVQQCSFRLFDGAGDGDHPDWRLWNFADDSDGLLHADDGDFARIDTDFRIQLGC